MSYRVTPDPKHPENVYFVNAVDQQDALLTLTELNINVYHGRIIDTDVSPKGHHLIVSSKKREQDTKELREQKPTTVAATNTWERLDFTAYGSVQAAAIVAGNAFIPEREESVQDVRNLLRDSIRIHEGCKQRAEDAKVQARFAEKQSERAKENVERVQAFLTLTLMDIAVKEALA